MAPAISTPVGPPPITDEGHQPPPLLRIAFVLGALERQQDATAQIGGVVDGLQARRKGRPVVVPEIGVPRTGREHQVS